MLRKPAAAEATAWALLAMLAGGAMLAWRPKPLTHDSLQYLSAAENMRRGQGISTTLVQYDTERTHGRIPAPLTTFPPGYPAAIALASGLVPAEAAARLISCACFAGTCGLLAWGLLLAGAGTLARRVALALFATNAVSLSFATAALAESMFTFLTTGAVVCLIWASAGKRGGVAAAGLFSGFAYLARYAGVFVMIPVTGYALRRAWARKGGERWRLAAAAMIPGAIAGCVMLRNVLLVGTWRGGNEMEVANPLARLLAAYPAAQFHLLFGAHGFRWGAWELAALAGGAGCLWGLRGAAFPPAARLAGMCAAIYSAGLLYAASSTVIGFDTRMFVPLLPCYLLLFGLSASSAGWGGRAALLLFAAGCAGMNGRDLAEPPRAPSRLEVLAGLFAGKAAGGGGETLREWVDAHIGAGETITAVDGQATGYLLRRPSLSMVTGNYTKLRWECGETLRQMDRFHSKYAIFYRAFPAGADENHDFLIGQSELAARAFDDPPPCGFAAAAESAGVRILTLPQR